MSTLLISAMIIAGTAGIFLLFIFISNRSAKERNKELLNRFYQAGAAHGMIFSSQEILTNHVIGLDGLHQHLLIIDFTNNNAITNIALADVKECTVKKEYDQVDYGNSKRSDIEKELRSIGIQFSLRRRSEVFTLPFYDSRVNSIYEMAGLHAKASHWQLLLSKMLSKEMEARA